jgi:hypothetical protein
MGMDDRNGRPRSAKSDWNDTDEGQMRELRVQALVKQLPGNLRTHATNRCACRTERRRSVITLLARPEDSDLGLEAFS